MKSELKEQKVHNKYGQHNKNCIVGLESAHIFMQMRLDQASV